MVIIYIVQNFFFHLNERNYWISCVGNVLYWCVCADASELASVITSAEVHVYKPHINIIISVMCALYLPSFAKLKHKSRVFDKQIDSRNNLSTITQTKMKKCRNSVSIWPSLHCYRDRSHCFHMRGIMFFTALLWRHHF